MRFLRRFSNKGRWRLDRLAAFSDGVIAIVITLLVLGLEVPSAHAVPQAELGEYLAASLYPLVGYIVSFVLIGMYWMQHYLIFHFLTHADRPFVVLNLLFLLCLTFLPFPTGLHAVYRDDELAVALYGGALALCGFSLLVLWYYATHRRRLVSEALPQNVVKSVTMRLAISPALCLVAIAASFINPWISRFVFLTIPLCYSSPQIDQASAEMQSAKEQSDSGPPE